MLKRLVLCVVIAACSLLGSKAQTPKVRISAWYWLNSAPKSEWQSDFAEMKRLGFTDVLMCWGVDLAGIVTRKNDTTEAIQEARKAGLSTLLIVWQPNANSLTRTPKYLAVDADGKALSRFDVFNAEWRNTQWKQYLQEVARTYGKVPGFRGYAFDDSFGGREVISYGEYEEKVFGAPLPRKPGDPRWDEWVKARQGWWEDWGTDTVKFIREIDSNRDHIIYVEDSMNSLANPKMGINTGLDFGRAVKHFDAIGGYIEPAWTSEADSSKKVSERTLSALKTVQEHVGPHQQMIFTFWTANSKEERLPGPAVHPTAMEIEQVCEDALHFGVKHLDMYGYRIGEYQVTKEQMAIQMPPEPAPYVVTGQFPRKFMYDRPEIKEELGRYLRSLNR